MNFDTKQIIFEGLTNVTKKVYATPAYEMKEILLNPAETNRANWQGTGDGDGVSPIF